MNTPIMQITIGINEFQLRLIREALKSELKTQGFTGDDLSNWPVEYFSSNESDELLILYRLAIECEEHIAKGEFDKSELQGWCL